MNVEAPMTEPTPTTEAEPNANDNSNWTRRTFMTALGATGIAAATAGAQATEDTTTQQMTTCCCQTDADESMNNEQLDALLARLEAAAEILEFPARRVGAMPRGEQHGASRWGIHFRTDQPVHLGETTVDAGQSGSFTAVVADYDGADQFDPVYERTIDVDAGINHINLDMALEPGEYLLTRDGSFPLRRTEWSGWESQSRDGLELLGGSKPGYDDNRFWYYFFDLNVAANDEAHI